MRFSYSSLTSAFALAAASCLIAAGCSGGSQHPNLKPVTGTVTHQGKLVEGAVVTFRAKDGSSSAFGRTDAAGKYQLTSSPGGNGALPGDYVVTITKIEFSGSQSVPENHPDYGKPNAGGEAKATNLLPEKYSDASKSPLTATVSATGENKFDFSLE